MIVKCSSSMISRDHSVLTDYQRILNDISRNTYASRTFSGAWNRMIGIGVAYAFGLVKRVRQPSHPCSYLVFRCADNGRSNDLEIRSVNGERGVVVDCVY